MVRLQRQQQEQQAKELLKSKGSAINLEGTSRGDDNSSSSDSPCLGGKACVLKNPTRLSNTFVTQPQQRNMANHIFGGFMMRRGYEVSKDEMGRQTREGGLCCHARLFHYRVIPFSSTHLRFFPAAS